MTYVGFVHFNTLKITLVAWYVGSNPGCDSFVPEQGAFL